MHIKDAQNSELLRIATSGSVDDGKSTLIGRLFFDCGAIYEDQLSKLKKDSTRGASEDIDFSLFTDGLSAEREQGITIDVAYRYLNTPKRRIIVADVPGHEQYTRNMATGASRADVALFLIDVKKGVTKQSKRHIYIAASLGVKHIVILINKMDMVQYDQFAFDKVKKDFLIYLSGLGVEDVDFIPVSALKGDMVVNRGENMNWFSGKTVLEFLEDVPHSTQGNLDVFRFPVQYVVRGEGSWRGYAGKVGGGSIKKGDQVTILPSGTSTHVKSIFVADREKEEASDPESVVLTLTEEVDVSRGDMIVKNSNSPKINKRIDALLFWFDKEPMQKLERSYLIKHTTQTQRCCVDNIYYYLDVDSLEKKSGGNSMYINDICAVSISARNPLLFDKYSENKNTGNFILIDEMSNNTVACGVICDVEKKTN